MPFGKIVLEEGFSFSGKRLVRGKMLPVTAFMIMDFRVAAILHNLFQFQKILNCYDHFSLPPMLTIVILLYEANKPNGFQSFCEGFETDRINLNHIAYLHDALHFRKHW